MRRALVLQAAAMLCLASLACGGGEATAPPAVHTESLPDGSFTVTVGAGEPQRLIEAAQQYRPVLSPDSRWLAVETRLFSDLQVVRVFRRDGDRFEEVDPDPVLATWARVASREGFLVEDVVRARASVAGWDDDDVLILELSGDLPERDARWTTVERVPMPDGGR